MTETPAPPVLRLRDAPGRLQAFLVTAGLAALALPLVLRLAPPTYRIEDWITGLVLVMISAVNVEMSRVLSGGLETTHQPHKALSAWAFAAALLLPVGWLLAVVPVTYAHARWRGLRVPLWKWVGSGSFLVLSGVAAAAVRHLLYGHETNLMLGDGGPGLVTVLLAAGVFLACETVLFLGTAYLNHAHDEVWLRQTLRSPSFYLTEAAVLLVGGLLAAVYNGGAWFIILFVPIYAMAQRAALHEPLRARAETAALLAAQNAELEEAHRFKADLLGMLAHEIGNPLTSVVGYAEIGRDALDEDDPVLARRALEVVESSAARVQTVLGEILTMVTAERQALVARPETCVLRSHLQAAVAARPRDLQPTVHCPDGLTAQVQPGHLDQMLANLLSNAEKYAGGAVQIVARHGTSGHVLVAVQDAGPGVPHEFRDRLFERFARHDAGATRTIGTGLGLFVTRELARANGGDVVHRPVEPSGAEFCLVLPA